jgi:hypothetical protein
MTTLHRRGTVAFGFGLSVALAAACRSESSGAAAPALSAASSLSASPSSKTGAARANTAPGEAPRAAGTDEALASELIALGQAEQALRRKLSDSRGAPDLATLHELSALDERNTQRLIAIVDARGWPTRSLVGVPASGAAWLILQHSPDQEFQQRMLPELERLMRAGEVRGAEYALLYDRVQMHAGRPQRYGSQFVTRDGVMAMHECEEPARLDERRASVGLGPIADYVRKLEDTYRQQIAPVHPAAPR